MHAVVVRVAIEAGQADAAAAVLTERIVPRVSALPGFSTGYWTQSEDRSDGLSMGIFDTQENAEAAAEFAQSVDMPPGVTRQSVEVRMVVANA